MLRVQSLLEKRARVDDRLYTRYGKPLEGKHKGWFMAISKDGQIILGKDDVEVLKKAIATFGSGNFAFRRVGFKALGKWRRYRLPSFIAGGIPLRRRDEDHE